MTSMHRGSAASPGFKQAQQHFEMISNRNRVEIFNQDVEMPAAHRAACGRRRDGAGGAEREPDHRRFE